PVGHGHRAESGVAAHPYRARLGRGPHVHPLRRAAFAPDRPRLSGAQARRPPVSDHQRPLAPFLGWARRRPLRAPVTTPTVLVPHPIEVLYADGVALVCGLDGQVRADELHGLFAADTRVLSTYRLTVQGRGWQLIGRSRTSPAAASWEFQNPA